MNTVLEKTNTCSLCQIPNSSLKMHFLATEDFAFYDHKGIDFKTTTKQLWKMSLWFGSQGGSTITTAKSLKNYYFLTNGQNC